MRRAGQAFDLGVHHARRDEHDHLPEEILIGTLFKKLFHCHSVDGHGLWFLSVRVWKPEPTAESARDLDIPGAAVDELGKVIYTALPCARPTGSLRATPPPRLLHHLPGRHSFLSSSLQGRALSPPLIAIRANSSWSMILFIVSDFVLFRVVMAPVSQELEHPTNPGWFKLKIAPGDVMQLKHRATRLPGADPTKNRTVTCAGRSVGRVLETDAGQLQGLWRWSCFWGQRNRDAISRSLTT